MSSSTKEHLWFSSKNIASLQLYYESSLFTRMDLIPFLLLYAFDANVYFYPQIYKDFTQGLLDVYLADYAHWNFQVYTWSLLGCWFAILHAFCHVICTLLEYWHLSIRCKIQYIKTNDISHATVALVLPPPHCGEDALCPLESESHDTHSIFFVFQQIKYSFKPSMKQFEELDFPTDLPIKHYIDPSPITHDDAEELKLKYGPNEFNIPMPKFWEIFQEHATAPFFLFQIFCVGLWCLDEYWMYSLFTLFMLIVFEMMMVKRRMSNMKMIRNMRTKPFFIYIYRNHRWERMSTTDIVPGDIVSLVRCHAGMDEDITNMSYMREETIVPCDVLLLSGTCVVDEALLTGESVPQIKEPIDVSNSDNKLDLKSLHKISLISGGTKIVTSSFDEDTNTNTNKGKGKKIHYRDAKNIMDCISSPPNDGAVARVLTTGFHTSQGELLRTILFSTSRVSVNNPESFVFIAILLCFAIVASGYVLYWGLKDETRSQYKLALNCIMIITSVVPPELPMELSLAVNNSMVKLLKQKIFCTEAFRIPYGGAVEVCCFDKTGTLTSDSFQVVGCTKLNIDHATTMQLMKKGLKSDDIMLNQVLTTNAKKFATDSMFVIAGCHSLIRLEGKIIGDPLEKCALSAAGWSFMNHVASPTSGEYPLVRIWHRFAFSSALKRMSCIVTVTKKRGSQTLTRLVCKGAAETIGQRLKSMPSNYNAVHSYFSRQGFRVLALAWKHLNLSSHKLRDKHYIKALKRNSLENDLIFAGFLVFACPHKPDSLDTIIQLKASSHAVVMITGDHVLTACAVAKDLYIATKPIVTLQEINTSWKWVSIDCYYDKDKEGIEFKLCTEQDVLDLNMKYDLCLSGAAIKYIRSTDIELAILSKLLLHVVIYARTSPVQKEFILSSLKSLGITTLMCGDGTNDVGALKQAHVGVALLSATAARQVEKAEEIRRKKIEEKKNNTMRRFGMSSFVEEQQKKEKERKEQLKRQREAKWDNDDDDDTAMSTQDLQKKMWDELMGQMEGDDDADMMMEAKPVQLGDASIASPFTSKRSSIEATIHIIRQGRCTLVTTLQMYSILALNCLISAYSLSVLYLEGVKFGDTQMTITGMMIAALFFFVTQSEPQFYLSEQQPHNSVFSTYIISSLCGQSITHLYTLMCAVAWSKPYTPTDEETRDPEGKFKPNVLNTVVFLVSTIQIVATFAANYAGYPFMQSLSDNKKLNRTILALCAVCFACGLGWWPSFDKLMQISELPSDEFRSNLLILMAADLSIVVGWERLCRHLFRKIPNPIVPVTKPPPDIIKKAKQKQRQKYLEQVRKQKELASKSSPWKMMKDISKGSQKKQKQQTQQ